MGKNTYHSFHSAHIDFILDHPPIYLIPRGLKPKCSAQLRSERDYSNSHMLGMFNFKRPGNTVKDLLRLKLVILIEL